jgi:hypothetical protein
LNPKKLPIVGKSRRLCQHAAEIRHGIAAMAMPKENLPFLGHDSLQLSDTKGLSVLKNGF